MIYNLENAPYSDRHGLYGGQAGDKDGILLNGEYWIVKYPKSTREMAGSNLPSYTTSPLSEYIGSHIYKILGYDVHETILGVRHGKLVVACKDFCEHRGDLAEIRTIKNAANEQLSQITETELPRSSTGDSVNLNELMLHFAVNPLLKDQTALQKRFWDTVVIDILINNNDRNNGNWGLLWNDKEKRYGPAPIYDNGNAFNNKLSESRLAELKQSEDFQKEAYNVRTAYLYNDKPMSAKRMLQADIPELKESILRTVPLIAERMPEIKAFINGIEREVNGMEVCSDIRKEAYNTWMQVRLDEIMIPRYLAVKNELLKEKPMQSASAWLQDAKMQQESTNRTGRTHNMKKDLDDPEIT